jgi:hypothetical protein
MLLAVACLLFAAPTRPNLSSLRDDSLLAPEAVPISGSTHDKTAATPLAVVWQFAGQIGSLRPSQQAPDGHVVTLSR